MIDRSHALSLARQAQLMQISRGAIYYRSKQSNSEQTQLFAFGPPFCRLTHAAWVVAAAKALGVTTSSWSACGAPSSTRKFTSKPMTACVPHAVAWSSTIQNAHIRHTAKLPPDEAYFAALPFAQMQTA